MCINLGPGFECFESVLGQGRLRGDVSVCVHWCLLGSLGVLLKYHRQPALAPDNLGLPSLDVLVKFANVLMPRLEHAM